MSLMSWFRKLFSRSSAQPKGGKAAAKGAKGAKTALVELGRNDACWCGSGKKYKKCHLSEDEYNQREARYAEMAAKSAKAKGGGDGITRSKAKTAVRPPENEAASRASSARR